MSPQDLPAEGAKIGTSSSVGEDLSVSKMKNVIPLLALCTQKKKTREEEEKVRLTSSIKIKYLGYLDIELSLKCNLISLFSINVL